jgi:AcrR family transcriptional regulator
MDCTLYRDMLDAYLDDTLDAERRTIFRGHLRDCAGCRSWALAAEPSLLFAVADAPRIAPDRIEACAAAVTAQIRQQRLARRLARPRRPIMAAAAAAVLALSAGLLWRLAPDPGVAPSPALSQAALERPEAAPPSVEVEMAGEGVRVYQLAAGGDQDTAVYFIVNPALEL